MNTPTPTNLCRQCGGPMASNAPEGLCARCLLSVALKASEPSDRSDRSDRSDGSDKSDKSAPAPADFPDIGDPADVARRLPQFEILELLGRGGMGVVYKARQLQLDRIVALKILPPADALSPDFVERFRREARSLAKLSHPNIVTVFDFGETGGLYYFVMELVDGVNLRDMIRAGKMKPEEALAVVPKICDALQFAHEEGVVHRDIKPENILIDKRGRVKIADFGLAKLLRREQTDYTLTTSGMTLGTPRYMAPEQLDKPETVDHRADIYSLGVVFYEMLTGEVPMGRFAPPSQKVQIDVRLDEIVLHALERDVTLRYQQASEMKSEVETVSNTPRAASSPQASQPSKVKSWSAWIWGSLLVLVILPFLNITELNRRLQMAGHGPKAFLALPFQIALFLIGAFAVIKLLEFRRAKAGAAHASPFPHAWLGIIAALFGVCIIATGPFPHVEWLHETLKVNETEYMGPQTGNVWIQLAAFSQVLVKDGYEFWQGKAIAAAAFLACAFLLLAPHGPRWSLARSALVLAAALSILFFADQFQSNHPPGLPMSAATVEERAKIDPEIGQFRDDLKHHLATEAEVKKLPSALLEQTLNTYEVSCNYSSAEGSAVCLYAALGLIFIGVLKLRQTMIASPAAFSDWHRAVESWSSLLWLAPCLISVLAKNIGWMSFAWVETEANIPLFKGESWIGEWIKDIRMAQAGTDFWHGRIIAAACILAVLVVIATALLRWTRGPRTLALSLAGLISITCAIHFFTGAWWRSETIISWDDFHAVVQHGAKAAESARTRQFLAEHPRCVGQLVLLEKNVQAVALKLTIPGPEEIPKETVTKSADGKTTYTTTTVPMKFMAEVRRTQAQKLAEGGGIVSLSTYSRTGPVWPVLFGLGLLLTGIRDGYRWWKSRPERRTSNV